MDTRRHRQRAYTLLELLIVIGIIGILLTLVLSAILRARESALQMESMNKLRQIVVATQGYADSHHGRLPLIPVSEQRGKSAKPVVSVPSLFVRILPHLEEANAQNEIRTKTRPFPLHAFLSPADPTAAQALAKKQAVSSYAANALVFRSNPRFPATFVDGTSNTIAFAEHYGYDCGGYSFYYWYNTLTFGPYHRATFGDVGDFGVGNTHTFQLAPSRRECSPIMAQTPHRNGMLAAMGDGSIRVLAPNISPNTYWGAVTPAGREVLGDDW